MAKKPPAKRSAHKGSKGFRTKPAPRRGREDTLPSREEILAFVRESEGKAGKREISRAFNIKGDARIGLKRLLAEMTDEGLLSGTRKEMHETGKLPPVTVLEITGRDDDGDLIAHPAVWKSSDGDPPSVLVLAHRARGEEREAALGVGDRILARITRLETPDVEGHAYEAEPIKILPRDKRRLLGIFRSRSGGGGTIEPVNRRELRAWQVRQGNTGDAKDGDLVRFDLSARNRQSMAEARILETLGNPNDQRKISLIAVHAHGLPDDFPASVMAESEALIPFSVEDRTDLRAIPLLTIDPVDARDHDDAVHAEPDTDPKNRGGFVVLVAIADVAHYVRPGSRLDKEAQLRGNSVYFPDRVVPMLPERISNDLCSLRELEDRPCLAVRMIFDANGRKRRHEFLRGVMKSAAKLSYQEAQAAIDGNVSEKCAPLMERALRPLWQAYAALARARDERGPLDLDLPERKILLDAAGRVARVIIPERLDAHRLIEEFMIQANVAAAETLEAAKTPLIYRTHDEPSKEKLKNLRDFLETLDLQLAPGTGLKPEAFNRILARAKTLPVPELVNEVILRSQAQAEYTRENIGHFGLNLAKYAHFTSPIRRYADLIVHRALIRAMKFGPDGLTDEEATRLVDVAKDISDAERRAMAAERETIDRLIAAHLADRVDASFEGRIAGVTRSGLFVKLKDTGADGFVPVSTLGQDFFNYVEEAHALVGNRSGETYQLGDPVTVRLVEVIPSAGAVRFEMLTPGKKSAFAQIKGARRFQQRRGRRR
ncbi:MAG: ribonuclease R [Hyphomicrobium sp.]|jgi:ribonuclease R|uniref:ribonuclease R n=1 Tax=Hyphomicrobium sp. TaxID=82 RepID=UPI0025BA1609|nr:ribonuclease R [Hyphomicrobium sp.]MBX9862969.1 ribonuclease R [Hyphomicrobium sp.]